VNYVLAEKMRLGEEAQLRFSKLVDAKEKMPASEFETRMLELGLSSEQKGVADKFFNLNIENLNDIFPGPAAQEVLELIKTLENLGVGQNVKFDPTIMRGLDYYTGVVFEAFDISPENNRALFGGGRYDNLVGLFSKTELSGAGFGLGDVTLQKFLETHKHLPDFNSFYDVYCACADEKAWRAVQKEVAQWRHSGLRVLLPLQFSGLKNQFKEANRFGVPYVVVVGDAELKSGQWTFKEMKSGDQREIRPESIVEIVKSLISGISKA
jgi:histidyl-tRNA synthetase